MAWSQKQGGWRGWFWEEGLLAPLLMDVFNVERESQESSHCRKVAWEEASKDASPGLGSVEEAHFLEFLVSYLPISVNL